MIPDKKLRNQVIKMEFAVKRGMWTAQKDCYFNMKY